MQIHQIQMSYDKLQDRILLRVSTKVQAEFRFWLTRRYAKLLWEMLMKMLERDPGTAMYQEEKLRRAMVGFQHQNAVEGGEFSKQYEDNATALPLGVEPVLLSRITAKADATAGNQVLCLHPEQGQGIDLAVNASLLHMIAKLLSDAVAQTDWNLKFVVDPDVVVPPQAQGIPPHKLN